MIALYPAGRERSAILPALYAIQREFGYCALEAQNELAAILNLEPAEVGAVVGFYHMLKTEPKGDYHVEVCTNVPCMLRGAGKCMNHLEEKLGIHHGHTTEDDKYSLDHMECLGSCGSAPMVSVTERSTGKIRYFEEIDSAEDVDKMLAVIENEHGFVSLERWTPEGDPENTGKAAGPHTHGGMDDMVLMARVDTPDSHKIETYLADGGYELAGAILKGKQPQEVVDAIKASGIRGRGGAGFPTGVKWGFLPQGVFPRYLVINADESEPGTFKDRVIMEYDPHQLIESAIISAFAIQAERVFIYIRGEYYFAAQRLNDAIAEAKAKGYLGEKIFGTNINVDILVHRGAGRLHLRRRDRPALQLGRLPGLPPAQAAFPGHRGAVQQAHHRQQRGIHRQCAACDEARRGMVPGLRHGEIPGHAHLLPQRQCEAARPLRAAPRRPPAGVDLQIWRRPGGRQCRHQGGDPRRSVRADPHGGPVGHAHGLRKRRSRWVSVGIRGRDRDRRAVVHDRRGHPHLGLLSGGKLRQVYPLSGRHALAGKHPSAHPGRRRTQQGH